MESGAVRNAHPQLYPASVPAHLSLSSAHAHTLQAAQPIRMDQIPNSKKIYIYHS